MKRMGWSWSCLATAAFCVLASWSHAATQEVFHETFNSVPLGAFVEGPGALTGTDVAGWNYTVPANAGTNGITEDATYGRHPEKTVSGSSGTGFGVQAPLATPISIDAVQSVTIEAKVRYSITGSSGSNRLQINLEDSADNVNKIYNMAFAGQNTQKPLGLMVGASGRIDVSPAATDIGTDVYQLRATFTKSGADTVANYQVQDLSGSTFSDSGIYTFTGRTLPAGTQLNQFRFYWATNTRCWIDDIIVSVETGSRVEDWRDR